MSMAILYAVRTTLLPSRRRLLSTVAASSSNNHQNHQRKNRQSTYVLTAAAVLSAVSIHTRRSRHENISSLIPARESGLLSSHQVSSIIEEVKRAGLMGKAKSVKEELDHLRQYHIENGYLGGLIVRDLSQPLFSIDDEHKDAKIKEVKFDSSSNDKQRINNTENVATKEKYSQNDRNEVDTNMAQRECYYLYYEIKSNGHTKQEIFCRGTTLLVDVLTCLQSWFIYDEELDCHVHRGFKKHADRVVEDVLPLLAKPGDYSTVGVAGHSLGGAVAVLVAAKLRKRGYRVTNVLSVAGPRVCRGTEDRNVLERSLPKRTLRIENDLDIVPLLPPSGVSVGDKLWLVSDEGKQKAFILSKSWLRDPVNSWTESVWTNMKVFETLINQHKTHRIATHVARLETDLVDNTKD